MIAVLTALLGFVLGWFLREMFHAVKVLRRAVQDAIEIFKL